MPTSLSAFFICTACSSRLIGPSLVLLCTKFSRCAANVFLEHECKILIVLKSNTGTDLIDFLLPCFEQLNRPHDTVAVEEVVERVVRILFEAPVQIGLRDAIFITEVAQGQLLRIV